MERLNSQTTPGWWKRFSPSHPVGWSPLLADVGGHRKHHVPMVGDTSRHPPLGAAPAKVDILGDHLSPQHTLGPARAAGNISVLTNTTTTAICPRYGDTCKNMTLLFKTSITVQCSGRGGPSLFNCRACLVFIMLRGGGGITFTQNHM